jgi:hypothetical protein
MTADHYLRFPDQPAALAAFAALGMTYTDDEQVEHASQGSHQYALHEVGEIPGKDGWHVNLRVIDEAFDVSSLEAFCVFPTHAVCVWA